MPKIAVSTDGLLWKATVPWTDPEDRVTAYGPNLSGALRRLARFVEQREQEDALAEKAGLWKGTK